MEDYEKIAIVGICLLFLVVIIVQQGTNKVLEENPVQNLSFTTTTVPEDKVNYNNVLLYIVIACVIGVVGLAITIIVVMKKTDRLFIFCTLLSHILNKPL